MNQEQIEQLKTALQNIRKQSDDVQAVIDDYEKCGSDISRKFLGAAIRKYAQQITAEMKPEIFEPAQA